MSASNRLRRPEPDQGADRPIERSKEDGAHHEGNKMIAHAATRPSQAGTSATGPSAARPAAAGTSATWPSERVAQLKSCIGAGLSCSQIAAEIGVTRNAVIGKMNRLGLSRPKDMLRRKSEPKRDPWRPRSVTKILTQHRILMELPPEPPAEEAFVPSGDGCSLLELSPGKCRWPISESRAEEFLFCGNNQVEGLPYCVGHARMAYRSTARVRSTSRP
jgi:GcrA cell cycle regulator